MEIINGEAVIFHFWADREQMGGKGEISIWLCHLLCDSDGACSAVLGGFEDVSLRLGLPWGGYDGEPCCELTENWVCWCCFAGLDFHEDLHRIGAKEGLKGRKLQKAMESYAWNITVLKVSQLSSLNMCMYNV